MTLQVDTFVHVIEQSSKRSAGIGQNDYADANEDPLQFILDPDNRDVILGSDFLEQACIKIEKTIDRNRKELVDIFRRCDFSQPSPISEIPESQSSRLDMLNDLWVIRSGIQEANALYEMASLDAALGSLKLVTGKIVLFEQKWGAVVVLGALRENVQALNTQIITKVYELWQSVVEFSNNKPDSINTLKILASIEVNGSPIDLDEIFQAITTIEQESSGNGGSTANNNANFTTVENLLQSLENYIFDPITSLQKTIAKVEDDNKLILTYQAPSQWGIESLSHILDCLETSINFISTSFGTTQSLLKSISKRVSSSLIHQLLTNTFPSLLPTDCHQVDEFSIRLSRVVDFEKFLTDQGWVRGKELTEWVDQFPAEWNSHRQSLYLDKLRKLLIVESSDLTMKKILDPAFSKPEPVARQSELQSTADAEDDWNKGWSDEEGNGLNEEEEDAWNDKEGEENLEAWNDDENDNVTGDWKWNDDDVKESSSSIQAPPKKPINTSVNQDTPENNQFLYLSISQLPDKFIDLLEEALKELTTSTIPQDKFLSNSLALYKALSPILYSKALSKLIMYNDLLFVQQRAKSLDSLISLNGDESLLLQQFSNRVTKEIIEEYQDQLQDILARANNFTDSGEEGNLFECRAAIERVVGLFNNLSEEWTPYTSFPLRSKLLGTLLEFVVADIISSIESQSDISEEESHELSKIIDMVVQLEDLFANPASTTESQNNDNLTAFYTPSWIKFQYLGEILQSNLTDLLYLYETNALMDFSSKEIISLIHALFAESDHRRAAIEQILSN